MKEDDQVARALIENSIASVREADPQLSHLPLDLRGERMLRRWRIRRLSVQMLFDVRVDLRGPLCRQRLDELRYGL